MSGSRVHLIYKWRGKHTKASPGRITLPDICLYSGSPIGERPGRARLTANCGLNGKARKFGVALNVLKALVNHLCHKVQTLPLYTPY